MWERAGEATVVDSEVVKDTSLVQLALLETVLMSRLTTLWQAVGNNLVFEVEVIDPKDYQRDVEQEEH